MVLDSLPSGSSSGHIPEYMCLEPLANLPEWFFIIINWLHQFIIYSFKDSDIKFSQDLLPSLIPAKRCSSPLLYGKKLVVIQEVLLIVLIYYSPMTEMTQKTKTLQCTVEFSIHFSILTLRISFLFPQSTNRLQPSAFQWESKLPHLEYSNRNLQCIIKRRWNFYTSCWVKSRRGQKFIMHSVNMLYVNIFT